MAARECRWFGHGSGNVNGLGTDDTEQAFAVTPAVCPTASWRGCARVEASTNPAVAVAVAARRRRQQQRRQLQLSGPVPAELDPDAFARSLALRERAYVSQALVPMPVTITTLTATCAMGVPSRRGLRGMATVAEVRAAAACCPCTTQSRAARTTQETPRPSPSLPGGDVAAARCSLRVSLVRSPRFVLSVLDHIMVWRAVLVSRTALGQ